MQEVCVVGNNAEQRQKLWKKVKPLTGSPSLVWRSYIPLRKTCPSELVLSAPVFNQLAKSSPKHPHLERHMQGRELAD